MRRVLMLATYPIQPPCHGGQRRANAIATSYRDCGWEVKHIGVFFPGCYTVDGDESDHLMFSKNFARDMAREQLRPDVHASEFFVRNPQSLETLIARVEKFHPQVIQFEQPWLFPALADYLRANRHRYRIIYSSQNVEHELLRDILVTAGDGNAEQHSNAAKRIEQHLAAFADATICVTETDAAVIRTWAAGRVVVANNGANPRPTARVPALETSLADGPFAVVAGSGHPPNCTGFLALLGTDFAFVPPHAKVVVAGGMAGLVASAPAFKGREAMLHRRAMLIEKPSENDLNYLINAASVVMLPITQGGGSNIKTAEALLTDRPIIGTSMAFRGFESFARSDGVSICDRGAQFRRAVRTALTAPRVRVARRPEADVLRWGECISSLPGLLDEVLADDAPAGRVTR